MTRWAPNARGRLEQAALEFYGERGFENTTVAEIAQRAGLSERTFFRHFADKREVLFWGAGALREFLVARVEGAPAYLSPIDAIGSALEVAGTEVFEQRREFAQRRQEIIANNAELQERELIKLAALASVLAAALRRRGVGEPVASLAAEAGISVFKLAFQAWVDDTGTRSLAEIIRWFADQLKLVAGEPKVTPGRRAKAAIVSRS